MLYSPHAYRDQSALQVTIEELTQRFSDSRSSLQEKRLSARVFAIAMKASQLKAKIICRSPDLNEQLFFHGSEVVKPEEFKGNALSYFKEHIAAGDEVEFVVGAGQRSSVGLQVSCNHTDN